MAEVLLVVTGSIAAYKAPQVIRALQKRGYAVTALLTRAAESFVAPLTLEVLTRRAVLRDLWSTTEVGSTPGEWTQHMALAQRVEAILFAPATAHTIARLAQGLCDDLSSAVFLATRKPVLIAPAMEGHMYRHPFVQAHLRRLARLPHVRIIPPGKGFLASGAHDTGRLASLPRLVAAVERAVSAPLLAGKKILLTAGATREYWDPVRFLSNGSTGQMALALAEAAYALGAAEVHVLAAHTEVRFPRGLFRLTPTPTAEAMLQAFQAVYERYDWLLFAAAVSDFTFAERQPRKHKKTGDNLTLSLVPAPDILAWAAAHRRPGQLLVGFALEEEGAENLAREKLLRKGADWLAYNPISPQTGMAAPTNAILLLSRWGHRYELPLAPKTVIARQLLIHLAQTHPT